ncbi:MAG: class I SAM-dependent methyltransferase [Chitinophagia bacterium]|nr:class I SAM-dependent methyltransferase [Chitinophagia bacterium]
MNLEYLLDNNGKRKASFELMLQKISAKSRPLIIETGCVRRLENFGDGMSTVIFDKYIDQNDGECYSIDINPNNIELAKSITKKVNLICSDSISYLFEKNKELRQQNRYVDLLYLDSFDFDAYNPHPSAMHHIMELLCIWPSCQSGTIIAVDDNFEGGNGKGKYIKQFMTSIGVPPIYDGYQIVWEL